MTLSLPSALAAVTSASMPPQSAADFADLALQELVPPLVPPHAATTTRATTTRASRPNEVRNFMLPSPLNRCDGLAPGWRPICRGNIAPAPAMMQGRSRLHQLISVSRRLILVRYRGIRAGAKGLRRLPV